MDLIKVAIHQPNFMPWTGYFHKIGMVDKFVFFDDVQFPRGKTFGNRVRIKTKDGELWLTVPVLDKSDLTNFNSIKINNATPWQRKMSKTIELSYKKARYFDRYFGSFNEVFMADYDKLIDLNIALIRYFATAIGLKADFYLSSEINSGLDLTAEGKIMNILRVLGAGLYVSGSGAGSRRYINEAQFEQEGMKIRWQVFVSPVYKQLWGEFIPDLSVLDLLFNCGDESFSVLTASS
jgi:hypothetical protein